MKQSAHSVNSSKNLLLINNNPNRDNNTETSNDTYSHLTTPEVKVIQQQRTINDLQNHSYNYNNTINNYNNNNNNRISSQNNLSYNNNNLIINTPNNSIMINNNLSNNNNNNSNINNSSILMSNTSNINNSFSLNNNSTRNLLGNNTLNAMNTSMNQIRHSSTPLISTSFNNSFQNNTMQQLQTPSPNLLTPVNTSNINNNSMNNSINNSINNSMNNNYNNMNTSSHNIKVLNSLDIPVTTSLNKTLTNKGANSPPVPPLSIGKDDSVYEEEKDNQIVVVIDPSTMLVPLNEVPNTIPDPKKIPNSVEDWIKYHAAIDPEREFLSPNEPPSKIPILESTIPLDEVITPQRSVSCRIRLLQQQRRKKAQELAEQEKLIQQNNSKSLNNAMNNDAIVYSSPSIKMPSAVRSSKKIKAENTNVRNSTNRIQNQKTSPRFQLCTYNKCEWIATNKCEKCSNLCCLDHSQRFYYFLPSLFSPKYYCPDCMSSVSKFWKYAYFIFGTLCIILLIVGSIYNSKNHVMNNVIFSLFCIIVVSLIISSYSLAYFSNQYIDKTKDSERLLLD